MSRDKRAETPLAHVIDDLRREPVPSVDWDSVEDELMTKAGRLARTQPKRAASPGYLRWSFAVAACVLGAAALVFAPRPDTAVSVAVAPPPPAAPVAKGELNGDALAVGALVSADSSAVVVTHAGHVTWKLDEGSAAHVESAGAVVALSLDRGAVSAKVVKSPRPETFVVRVEKTRIAVHGTEFRVERVASGVKVTVSEGVLGIGPVGGPSFELSAPGAATLNLEGIRTDARKPPVASVKRPGSPETSRTAAASTPPVAASEQTADAAEAPAAAKPAAVPPSATPHLERVATAVQHCFGSNTRARGDLHVNVMTKMALRVTTDGRVGDAIFEPPLAPGVRECVDEEVGAIHFPESAEGFVATRILELAY